MPLMPSSIEKKMRWNLLFSFSSSTMSHHLFTRCLYCLVARRGQHALAHLPCSAQGPPTPLQRRIPYGRIFGSSYPMTPALLFSRIEVVIGRVLSSAQPVNVCLKKFKAGEDAHGDDCKATGRRKETESNHGTDACERPDNGGRGHPLHPPSAGNDDTGPKKYNARNDLAEHAGHVRVLSAIEGTELNEDGSSETDQDIGANPCRLAAHLTLKTHH